MDGLDSLLNDMWAFAILGGIIIVISLVCIAASEKNKDDTNVKDECNKTNGPRMTLYWAYLHKYGTVQVKPWHPGNSYLDEARVSPMVERYLQEPFKASSYEEAERTAAKLLGKSASD